MAESPNAPSTEMPALDAGKWIGRVIVAVLLGEGVWGLIVALTSGLLVPFVARTTGADPQSPLYLGKGDFNFPAVFVSVLELCFAGIVAVILYSWVQRKSRLVRSRPAKVSPVAAQPARPAPSAAPAQVGTSAPVTSPASPAAVPSPGQFWSPPQPPVQPQAAPPPEGKVKPATAKPPKEVYYNIVGEPLTPEDE